MSVVAVSVWCCLPVPLGRPPTVHADSPTCLSVMSLPVLSLEHLGLTRVWQLHSAGLCVLGRCCYLLPYSCLTLGYTRAHSVHSQCAAAGGLSTYSDLHSEWTLKVGGRPLGWASTFSVDSGWKPTYRADCRWNPTYSEPPPGVGDNKHRDISVTAVCWRHRSAPPVGLSSS